MHALVSQLCNTTSECVPNILLLQHAHQSVLSTVPLIPSLRSTLRFHLRGRSCFICSAAGLHHSRKFPPDSSTLLQWKQLFSSREKKNCFPVESGYHAQCILNYSFMLYSKWVQILCVNRNSFWAVNKLLPVSLSFLPVRGHHLYLL
jgi:hypothetical protein